MSAKVGLDAKLYYNSGTYASPSWVEVTDAQDVTLSLEAGEAEVNTRASVWRQRLSTLLDASVEFTLLYDTDNAPFSAIQEAFTGRTTLEFAVMDGDVTSAGVEGLRATMRVYSFSRSEPLEEGLTVDVTLRVAPSDNDPAWWEVTT